ncbi:MAG: nucleotide exchange factor GrpE [Betaproteobacteria bacterium TMED156]|nr:MAG: nucleotide exchange factor GrpE [Betaproteobacteria bacterium TMED156]|tara:strand:- start:652 stop:1290 length:639 start_codon:yes stop_codon:yes gene_type:complete
MNPTKKDPYQEVSESLESDTSPIVGSNIDSASSKNINNDENEFIEVTQDNTHKSVDTVEDSSTFSKLESDLLTEKDKSLRLQAELDNVRKRSSQEVLNAGKFAIEDFALNLLPVADSLEAALELKEQSSEQLKSGVELTLKQLEQTFERSGLKIINPKVSDKFDPNQHQAVSTLNGEEVDPIVSSGHIISVLQKGYFLAGRVLRPALVVVAA